MTELVINEYNTLTFGELDVTNEVQVEIIEHGGRSINTWIGKESAILIIKHLTEQFEL